MTTPEHKQRQHRQFEICIKNGPLKSQVIKQVLKKTVFNRRFIHSNNIHWQVQMSQPNYCVSVLIQIINYPNDVNYYEKNYAEYLTRPLCDHLADALIKLPDPADK